MDQLKDVSLVLIIRKERIPLDLKKIHLDLVAQFSDIVLLFNENVLGEWLAESEARCIRYSEESGKVDGINRAVAAARYPWVLILEEDEKPDMELLRNVINDGLNGALVPFLVESNDPSYSRQNHQVRLVARPDGEALTFEGFMIPDLMKTFHMQKWQLAQRVIPLEKEGPLFSRADIRREVEYPAKSVMRTYWKGIWESGRQQFSRAERCFRSVLEPDISLFQFDQLSVLNGLCNALVEQHKLEEAHTFTEKSLTINALQRAPYLNLYKIHSMRGEREKAVKSMESYISLFEHFSRANMDVVLPLREAHFLIAETAIRLGNYDKAFSHYEEFYRLNKGNIGLPVLEKLFIYAIELENYQKAVQYFYDIFGDQLPDKLDDGMSGRLLEALSLFMDNGWYDFVSSIYEELVTHNPDDNSLLTGWINTLVKNRDIEKAQSLINCVKKKKCGNGG